MNFYSNLLFFVLIACANFAFANDDFPYTFGGSISVGHLEPGEKEYPVFTQTGAGLLTFFWMTVGDPYKWDDIMKDIVVRYYIDNEKTASLEFKLDLMHGIGFGDESAPWESGAMAGKGAITGGLFNTFRIPFGNGVKITFTGPPSQSIVWHFYSIVRGQAGLKTFRLGDFNIPVTARLRLNKEENVKIDPMGYLTLIKYSDGPGALLFVVLQVESGTMNFLEGCVRTQIDSLPWALYASGTEDYFQSAFYFDGGPFHFQGAGLTHLNQTDPDHGGVSFSAYKYHTQDSIFWRDSILMTWRNGDTIDEVTHLKCPMEGGKPLWDPRISTISMYSLYYTF